MNNTFEEYIEFIKKLSIKELRIEATIIKNYLDSLNKVYNGLIDLIRNGIVICIKDEMYFNPKSIDKKYILNKLSLLDNYLNNEVYSFFNNKNDLRQNIEVYSDYKELDEKKLYEIIIEYYSLIYKVREQLDLYPMFEYLITYKGMSYSLFDALSNLYLELHLKVKLYIEQLYVVEENKIIEFTNNFITDLVNITEKYCEHYIDIAPKFKEILDEDIYITLLKYNCLNTIKEMIFSPALVGFDLADLKYFLKNSLITKIINNDQEIVLSDLKPNKVLIAGFNDCKTLNEILDKVKKYKKECSDDPECIYGNSNRFLVVYLLDKE